MLLFNKIQDKAITLKDRLRRRSHRLLGTILWVTNSKSYSVIGRDLGKGTFGKVKVGTHVLTGEKVAVKILEKDKIVDVSDVERVAREIHILKIVRHPHVV
jgi:5'-AMP-activated protein kinase, catalytic alpha subunit